MNYKIKPSVMHNKTLKPDKDGYYRTNLGALNVENTSGIFYEMDKGSMDSFVGPNSLIKERIEKKCLYAELGHPEHSDKLLKDSRSDNKSVAQQARKQMNLRTMKIDSQNYVAHIREVEYIPQPNVIDPVTGKPKMLMVGYVKPFGKHKQLLIDAFENPNISVAFSLRGIAKERTVNGRKVRRVQLASTWDFVPKPGIPGSTDQAVLGYEEDEMNQILEDMLIPEKGELAYEHDFEIKCIKGAKTIDDKSVIGNW